MRAIPLELLVACCGHSGASDNLCRAGRDPSLACSRACPSCELRMVDFLAIPRRECHPQKLEVSAGV